MKPALETIERAIAGQAELPLGVIMQMARYFANHRNSSDRAEWEAWGGDAADAWSAGILAAEREEAAKSQMPRGVDPELWLSVYIETLEDTGDRLMARLAADGQEARSRLVGLKSADGDGARIGGWAILFTDAEKKDRQGTYFTRLTNLYLDYYQTAPLFWEHGRELLYGTEPIGRRAAAQVYPQGVWVEHDLHGAHPHYADTVASVRANEVGYSSDSIIHLAAKGYKGDGELRVWPMAGCSLTRNPAEPGLGPVALKSFEDALSDALNSREREAGEIVEALSAEKTEDIKEPEMPPETAQAEAPANPLANLASFLNLPPDSDRDTISTALEAFIGGMETPAPELLAALGLPAEADKEAVANALRALLPAVPSAASADMQAPPGMNYGALASAVSGATAAAKSMPTERIPYLVNDSQGRAGGVTTYSTVNYNFGAKKPGILEAVTGAMKGGAAAKSMSYGVGPSGGFVMRQETSNEILDPLRAQSVLFRAGTRQQDMQGIEAMTIPRMSLAPDAYWVGEGQDAGEGTPTYGTITLYPKPLAVLVKVPFKSLNNITPQAETQLRNQMVLSAQLAIDKAGLLGTGGVASGNTGAQPVGIINTSGVTITALGSGNGSQPTWSDLTNAAGRIDDANVPNIGSRAWIANSRTFRTFTSMTDDQGRPLLRESWAGAAAPTLIDFPRFQSNQIPSTYTVGTSTDCTYLIHGEFQYAVLGLSTMTEIRVLNETYATQLAAGLLLYVYVDFAVDYAEAFQVLSGVRA